MARIDGQTLRQFLRFAMVGGLGFIVDVGFTLMLIALGMNPLLARIVAIVLALFTTWRLNRAVTFGASGTSQASEGVRYFVVATGVALINYSIYAALLLTIPSIPPGLAVMIAVAFATGFSYTGYRFFAFKKAA
ncbi:MAG: GtrA family protein [Pseudomonadota bacterium]